MLDASAALRAKIAMDDVKLFERTSNTFYLFRAFLRWPAFLPLPPLMHRTLTTMAAGIIEAARAAKPAKYGRGYATDQFAKQVAKAMGLTGHPGGRSALATYRRDILAWRAALGFAFENHRLKQANISKHVAIARVENKLKRKRRTTERLIQRGKTLL
ncbi:MAG TPA: hypothetical protein VF286_10725 [Acidiphilium sp.]